MSDFVNRIMTDVTETVGPLAQQVGGQIESLQAAIALNPSDREVNEALGAAASNSEREAYRLGHQAGWYKGALMFGCAALAGLAIMTLANSGDTQKK